MSEWDGDDFDPLPERRPNRWGAILLAGIVGVGTGLGIAAALGTISLATPQGFAENPPALAAVTDTALWDAPEVAELAGQDLGWGGLGTDYASARVVYLAAGANDDIDAFVAAAEADGFDMGPVTSEPFDDTVQVLATGTKEVGDVELMVRISTFANGPSVYVYIDAYGID